MDDEAEEVNLLDRPSKRTAVGVDKNLEDSSEDEDKRGKTWDISDEQGNTHTVSIKETKGKWIYMSTGARILAVVGKPAEEVVQDTIGAGDEADLLG